jgi:hypothetical protein
MDQLRSLAIVVCLTTLPAQAFVDPVGRSHQDREIPRLVRDSRGVDVRSDDGSPSAELAAEFEARHGGAWSFRADPRTGRFDLVQGSGIPVIPGRGNQLGPDALAGLDRPDGVVTVDALAPRISEFLAANHRLLVPARGELVLDRERSLMRDGAALSPADFNYRVTFVDACGEEVPFCGATDCP